MVGNAVSQWEFGVVVTLVAFTFAAAVGCRKAYNAEANLTSSIANSNSNSSLYALDLTVPPLTTMFQVPANIMWLDTGVELRQGDPFQVQASGEWSAGGKTCGPFGLGNSNPKALIPEANLGSLVAKIGTHSFYLGDRLRATSPDSGKLYLSINYVPGSFQSNRGSMIVTVTYANSTK